MAFRKEHLEFLLQILTAKTNDGRPMITVGVESAETAAQTLAEVKSQLETLQT